MIFLSFLLFVFFQPIATASIVARVGGCRQDRTARGKREDHQMVSEREMDAMFFFLVADNEDSPQQVQRRRPRGRPQRPRNYQQYPRNYGYRRGGPPRGGPPRGGGMRGPPRGPPPDGPPQVRI